MQGFRIFLTETERKKQQWRGDPSSLFFFVWKFKKKRFAKLTHVSFSTFQHELQPKNIYSLRDAVDVECAGKRKSWNIRSPNVLCRPLLLFSSLWLNSWFTFHWSFCFRASFWTICHWLSPFSQLLKCCLADCLQLILYIESVFSCDERLHPFPSLADTCVLKISVGKNLFGLNPTELPSCLSPIPALLRNTTFSHPPHKTIVHRK